MTYEYLAALEAAAKRPMKRSLLKAARLAPDKAQREHLESLAAGEEPHTRLPLKQHVGELAAVVQAARAAVDQDVS